MMEEELPEVDYNFEQWCIRKIANSNDELSKQVTVLLDKVCYWQLSKILNVFQKNEWIVKLLQPMLAKNPACRPQPQHVLKKLGPVVNFSAFSIIARYRWLYRNRFGLQPFILLKFWVPPLLPLMEGFLSVSCKRWGQYYIIRLPSNDRISGGNRTFCLSFSFRWDDSHQALGSSSRSLLSGCQISVWEVFPPSSLSFHTPGARWESPEWPCSES